MPLIQLEFSSSPEIKNHISGEIDSILAKLSQKRDTVRVYDRSLKWNLAVLLLLSPLPSVPAKREGISHTPQPREG